MDQKSGGRGSTAHGWILFRQSGAGMV